MERLPQGLGLASLFIGPDKMRRQLRRGLNLRSVEAQNQLPRAASSRSVVIRFCSVRRLIPNISAASLRLPRTCSRVSLM